MKFLETHFEEYVTSVETNNLHPKLEKVFSKFPKTIERLSNLIYYGPSGVGKYSQLLYSLKRYSPSGLKYEKKLTITYDKKQYFFKISDIHYEVDMSLLGCNSKLLWHDIYQQIVDILSAKPNKTGIIVCKDFHHIHSELLENFYSYMQYNNSASVDIKFILLTEEVSFIPDSILNCCEIINIARPTKAAYNKVTDNKVTDNKVTDNKVTDNKVTDNKVTDNKVTDNKVTQQSPISELRLENIVNIKYLHVNTNDLMYSYKIICDKILKEIINIDELKFIKFRDLLYDIFIYNLDITVCIWYILTQLINEKRICKKDLSKILTKTYDFLKYYNNNYRPIYHLESYLFYLTSIIHGFKI